VPADDSDPDPVDWTVLARTLATRLTVGSTDPVWRVVLAAVPRHVLIPRFYRRRARGGWETVGVDHPDYWPALYADRELVTDTVPLTTCAAPGTQLRLAEALALRGEHRVLEVGTGTGYGTALLAHRLGDRQVFSVQPRPELVERARRRLANAGYRPALTSRDGAAGLAEHAPYDRILARLAVPVLPPAWLAQLAPGGLVVAEVRGSLGAGGLVLLRGFGDGAAGGAFGLGRAGFPALGTPAVPRSGPAPHTVRLSVLGPDLLADPVGAFVAQLHLPSGCALRGVDTLVAPDGSWCQVTPVDGGWQVAEAGPDRLWARVEHGHAWWLRAGRPDWPSFGYVADRTGQRVFVAGEEPREWPLSAA
jgi:protein-L-isoaspartate O-methyltransferase